MNIVYVLSGGSLRGIAAQLGAISILEDVYGIRPAGIVGTSAGSFSGGFYAAGLHPSTLIRRMEQMSKRDYMDPNWFKILGSILLFGRGLSGICEGNKLHKWLTSNLPIDKIESTEIPLAINVTNVSTIFPEVRTTGPLASYIRASTAIPFVFKPQRIGINYYVDGGVVNNIPLDEASRIFPNADAYLIITTFGLDYDPEVSYNKWLRKPFTPLTLLMRILKTAAVELQKDNLNVQGKPVGLLRIDPGQIGLEDIHLIRNAYEKAKDDARSKAPEVLRDIGFTI